MSYEKELKKELHKLSVSEYLGRLKQRKLMCIPFEIEIHDTEYTPQTESIINSEMSVSTLLGVLSQKEREIIKFRYGIGGGGSKTLEETGTKYGCTRERIRQMEAKAIEKIKQGNCYINEHDI